MADTEFPTPAADIVSILAEIYRHNGRGDIVELIESANVSIDLTNYDRWDGGIYTWTLRLYVPVALFAANEASLPTIEKEFVSRLSYLGRLHQGHILDEATIVPLAPGTAVPGTKVTPSEHRVRKIWPSGRFRLFLSHVAAHKIEVAKLKEELALRGIAAFVAHEDIEPASEWQDEIEVALRSMHALSAVLTPQFHASPWTDQELGWALGRGILIIPIRCGIDPYGLAGKYQGVPGSLLEPKKTAIAIVTALLANDQTHGEMRRALAATFSTSESYVMTHALRRIIVEVADFTEEEKTLLRNACTENSNVSAAHYAPESIYSAFGRPPAAAKTKIPDEEVPF